MLTVSRFIHHHHPNQFLCVDVLFVCVCSDIGVKNYFLSHRDDQHLLNLFSLKLCCTSIYCIKYLFGNYCFQLLCSNLSMQILYFIFDILYHNLHVFSLQNKYMYNHNGNKERHIEIFHILISKISSIIIFLLTKILSTKISIYLLFL